jgi:hypothetical protein
MPAATLDTIEAVLFAQLETLLATATPAGPLARVARFAGEIGRDRAVDAAALGVTPAALLAFESEAPEEAIDVAGGPAAFVLRSTWRVYVVASELRGHDEAVKGSSTTGVYSLVHQVQAKLAGLVIDGLWHSGRVDLLDARPFYVTRGTYVYVVRVAAQRELAAVAQADTSSPLAQIDGDLNLRGGVDTPPDPLTEFRTTY